MPSPSRPSGFQGSQNCRPGGGCRESSGPSGQTGGVTQNAFANANQAAAKGSMGGQSPISRMTGRGNATFQQSCAGNQLRGSHNKRSRENNVEISDDDNSHSKRHRDKR